MPSIRINNYTQGKKKGEMTFNFQNIKNIKA